MIDYPIDNVKIDQTYRKSLGDLKQLAASIATHGLLHPIVIRSDGQLVAGRRRIMACKTILGWKTIPVNIVDISNILGAQHDENVQRKDFTYSELVAIEDDVKATRVGHRPAEKGVQKDTLRKGLPPGKSRTLVAKVGSVSENTLWKARKVVEAAKQNPRKFGHLVTKMDKDGKVDFIYKQLQANIRAKKRIPLPNGEFNVLYADPGLKYDIALRGDPQQHYNTMSPDDVCKLDIPSVCAKNAVLLMWTTVANLKAGLQIMEAWGFQYKTKCVWVKVTKGTNLAYDDSPKLKIGTGSWFRGAHEDLLLGIKGKWDTPLTHNRLPNVVFAPIQEHSKKPIIFYNIIEQMFPKKKYLELFARARRKGWASWGDETKGSGESIVGDT